MAGEHAGDERIGDAPPSAVTSTPSPDSVWDAAELDGTFTGDRDGIGHCFGCGPDNSGGLRLRFRQLESGDIETRLAAPTHFQGVDGVLHGGIQAAVLDEVMGIAAEKSLPAGTERTALVTAELALRYLRPVLMNEVVVARARVVGVHGSDVFVHGEIIDGDGRELTTARSRWRMPRSR